jgi:hypothetical protein
MNMTWKIETVSVAHCHGELFEKINTDLKSKFKSQEDFESRILVYCLEIANDRQCKFYSKDDRLIFVHKSAQIDVEKWLEKEGE